MLLLPDFRRHCAAHYCFAGLRYADAFAAFFFFSLSLRCFIF